MRKERAIAFTNPISSLELDPDGIYCTGIPGLHPPGFLLGVGVVYEVKDN